MYTVHAKYWVQRIAKKLVKYYLHSFLLVAGYFIFELADDR
jgi:hypothetical protein